MEMNRRTFLKYFFVFTAVTTAGCVLREQLKLSFESDGGAVKIKKYIGRTRLMGTEIGEEGKWLG